MVRVKVQFTTIPTDVFPEALQENWIFSHRDLVDKCTKGTFFPTPASSEKAYTFYLKLASTLDFFKRQVKPEIPYYLSRLSMKKCNIF
jgi:hypothetical protein